MFKTVTNQKEALVNSLVLAIIADDDEKSSMAVQLAESFKDGLSEWEIHVCKVMASMVANDDKYFLMSDEGESSIVYFDEDLKFYVEWEKGGQSTDTGLLGLENILYNISKNWLQVVGVI